VLRRDEQDTNRPVAPLRQAADAVRIDNSDITIDETVVRMAEHVRARMGTARGTT
jgi:cytidylate kinase